MANADFSAVLAKIGEIVPKHASFKRAVGNLDESTVRYAFKQPSDAKREIILINGFGIRYSKVERKLAAGRWLPAVKR